MAAAQALPTADRDLQITVFGGITGLYTGLDGGRNLSITAGGDIGVRSRFGIYPAAEVRGTYAIDKGKIDNQKNVLVGLRLGKIFGPVRPYGDFLVGRGQINYTPARPDALTPSVRYNYSTSTVLSPGAGFDVQLTRAFAVKFDGQYQRYATPVTPSGHLYAKPFTIGVVYRFFSDDSPRVPRRR